MKLNSKEDKELRVALMLKQAMDPEIFEDYVSVLSKSLTEEETKDLISKFQLASEDEKLEMMSTGPKDYHEAYGGRAVLELYMNGKRSLDDVVDWIKHIWDSEMGRTYTFADIITSYGLREILQRYCTIVDSWYHDKDINNYCKKKLLEIS